MNTILGIIGFVILVSVIIFGYEIKHAQLIPDDVPFLDGDYNPYLEPDENFKKVFCKNCLKNIDGVFCNNGKHFGKVGSDMIQECKKEHYFDPK